MKQPNVFLNIAYRRTQFLEPSRYTTQQSKQQQLHHSTRTIKTTG